MISWHLAISIADSPLVPEWSTRNSHCFAFFFFGCIAIPKLIFPPTTITASQTLPFKYATSFLNSLPFSPRFSYNICVCTCVYVSTVRESGR